MDDKDTHTPGHVTQQALRTLTMVQQASKEQAAELQALLRAEIRQVGTDFRAEAARARNELQRALDQVFAQTEQVTAALMAAQEAFASQRKRLYWGLGAVVGLCILSLVATYEALAGHYQKEFAQLQAQVSYMQAINRSDVAPCGDGRLCARIDGKKQYQMIELRSSP